MSSELNWIENILIWQLELSFPFFRTAFKYSLLLFIYLFYFFKQKLFLNFLKYKFIYFNWRLITLQYCIGFAIHQHESATGIHMFPIPNPPPSSFPIIVVDLQYF